MGCGASRSTVYSVNDVKVGKTGALEVHVTPVSLKDLADDCEAPPPSPSPRPAWSSDGAAVPPPPVLNPPPPPPTLDHLPKSQARRWSVLSRRVRGGKSVREVVTAAFPGAKQGSAVMSKVLSAMQHHGLNKKNTIYGQSICSDEINGDPGHLPTLLTQYYGRTFPLGGIGGAPYVGKTGFMAFSHHVPDDGHVLIVFGPHIGFSPDGVAGKFMRTGQAALSSSCGAVIAAHSQICAGCTEMDAHDMEQSWLRSKLVVASAAASAASQPMVELVMGAYKEIEKEMLAITNTDYGPGNLVLFGGIQINMPYPMPGYWMPLHFSIRSRSLEPKDLMGAFA